MAVVYFFRVLSKNPVCLGGSWLSIRGKLKFLTCTVLFVIVVMAGVTYSRASSMLNDFLSKAGTEMTVAAASGVARRLDNISDVTSSVASALGCGIERLGLTDGDVKELVTALLNANSDDGYYDIYFAYGKTGKISSGSGWTPPDEYDARKRSWYEKAEKAAMGTVVFEDPYIDPGSGEMVVTAAQAVYDEKGGVIGVAASDVYISDLSDFVSSARIFGHGTGSMVQSDGLIISHPKKEYILKGNILSDSFDDTVRAMGRRMVAGETGFIDYEEENEDIRGFFAPVRGYDYSLGVNFPMSVIDGMVRTLTVILLIIAAGALIVCACVVFMVTRSIDKGLSDMDKNCKKLGEGDLAARFDDTGKDELSRMAGALNGMITSVSDVIRGIRTESVETTRQAETLAALSEETLASMEEVDASLYRVKKVIDDASAIVNDTSSSVQEIAGNAEITATNSTEGATQASQVTSIARDAVEEVALVLNCVRDAKVKSGQSIGEMRELGQAVDAISSFVSTITSIADQTNLLALNAAIEAARAGDAGRGFAVVAEEVRKLAEESAQASQEVTKLMSVLQGHSQSSIDATEVTEDLLVKSLGAAESTERRLQDVTDAMVKLDEVIKNIAALAQEQACSSEDISTAIEKVVDSNRDALDSTESISSSTQETTRAAENIAMEAQTMAATAERLQKLVDIFHFQNDELYPVKRLEPSR